MNKSTDLILGKHLTVPQTIAARTVFIAGTKGSGKTYTAGVMAEEMLDGGIHTAILDPLGVWWGLRHDTSGGPGGYPIIILGGDHGDVPLLPSGGEAVADFIVRSGQSVILDMSGFDSDAEQDRFVEALLARLFRIKAAEKSALHLIMDEADMFLPENPMKGQERMVGSSKRIVTKGRSRGLSMTMITQRPQAIKKAAIEESDVVLCHRLQGVNAIKAMRAWTDLYATEEQAAAFYESIPTLADGECWVWSPRFLKMFARHQLRTKRTFDSSRTPDPGERAAKPKAAAAVDLEKLTTEMKATAEAAKASDPTALRAKIAELERTIKQTKPAARVDTKTIERFVLKDGQLDRAEKLIGRLGELYTKAAELQVQVKAAADEVTTAIRMTRCAESRENMRGNIPSPTARPTAAYAPRAVKQATKNDGPARDAAEWFQPAHQRLLDAIAWLNVFGIARPDRSVVAAIAGVSPRSSSFTNNVSRLSSEGLIRYPSQGQVELTEEGAAVARAPEQAPDLASLQRRWLECPAFDPAHVRLITVIIEAYPGELTRDELAEAAGVSPNSSSFTNNVSRLSSMGLIEYPRKGSVRASSLLFPDGLA